MNRTLVIDVPQADCRVLRARHEVLHAQEAAVCNVTGVPRVVLVDRYLFRALEFARFLVDREQADRIGCATT